MNTKARHEELSAIAAAILSASGADITGPVSLAPMIPEMVERGQCHPGTARNHLARAVRRARGELVASGWGGAREGAGRGHIKEI